MEFFVSRVYYSFFSVLSFIISIVFIVSLWDNLIYRTEGYQAIAFFVLVFLAIGVYLYIKSINKKALIIIDDKKISMVNKSKSYYFEDLGFFRQEKILARTSFEYIHIYDNKKNKVFYFNLDEIDNKDELLVLIDKKLIKLK